MKLIKISLVAGLLLGANLYAIDNIKVNGKVQLLYGTEDDSTATVDTFDKDASYVDTALHLGLTADLSEGVSTGISMTALSTLGLENNLGTKTSVWSGAHGEADPINGQVDDVAFIDELWIAGTAGKTTSKLGRQALDTPFVFTEDWAVSTNTFEAAVLINEDLPGTTLIGAWVGKSNGIGDDTSPTSTNGTITATDGKFNTFADNGAYVVGAINNSWEPLTAQAWYYGMTSLADAYWLQADLSIEGFSAGAQYAIVDSSTAGDKDDAAYGLMLGYEIEDVVSLTAAYSSVDDEGTFGVANVATRGTNAGSQSKLYTEMWWWYGTVSATGADAIAVAAETTVGDGYDLYLGYWSVDTEPAGATKTEVDEVAFTVSKSYGPLDTSVAIIYDDFGTEDLTTYQLYLTYNF